MRPRGWYAVYDMGRVTHVVHGYDAARAINKHRSYHRFTTRQAAEEHAAWHNYTRDQFTSQQDYLAHLLATAKPKGP